MLAVCVLYESRSNSSIYLGINAYIFARHTEAFSLSVLFVYSTNLSKFSLNIKIFSLVTSAIFKSIVVPVQFSYIFSVFSFTFSQSISLFFSEDIELFESVYFSISLPSSSPFASLVPCPEDSDDLLLVCEPELAFSDEFWLCSIGIFSIFISFILFKLFNSLIAYKIVEFKYSSSFSVFKDFIAVLLLLLLYITIVIATINITTIAIIMYFIQFLFIFNNYSFVNRARKSLVSCFWGFPNSSAGLPCSQMTPFAM